MPVIMPNLQSVARKPASAIASAAAVILMLALALLPAESTMVGKGDDLLQLISRSRRSSMGRRMGAAFENHCLHAPRRVE